MLEKMVSILLSSTWNAASARLRPVRTDVGEASTPELREGDILIGHVLDTDGPAGKARGGAVILRDADIRRGVHIMGRPGAGKSVFLMVILSALLGMIRRTGQGSLCVMDMLGDRIDDILALIAGLFGPEEAARSVVLIDGRQDSWIAPLNPLAGQGDPHARALFTLGFVRRFVEGWGVTVEWCFSACLLVCALTGLSLADLIPLLEDERLARALLSQINDPQCHRFFRHLHSLGSKERLAFVASIENKLAALMADRRLWLALAQRETLDIGALLDTPGKIILIALGDRPQTADLMGSLLMGSIQGGLLARASLPEGERVRTSILIDEFGALSDHPEFEALSSQCRRLNARLILANQSLMQLNTRIRHALRNHSGASVLFATGFLDAKELCHEINMDLPQDELRDLLVNNAAGQGFIVRPSQQSLRFQALNYIPPEVSPGDVRAVREAALRACARPAAEIERELAGRAGSHLPLRQGWERGPEDPENEPEDESLPVPEMEVEELDDRTPRRRGRSRKGKTPQPDAS